MNSSSTRVWSAHQQAVFADVASGSGNTVVLARAGSGKTSTIFEALNYIPRGKRTLLVTFAKANTDEAKARIVAQGLRGVDAMTLHSLGLRSSGAQIDMDKTKRIVNRIVGDQERETYELEQSVIRVMNRAKDTLVESGAGFEDAIDGIIDELGVVPPEVGEDRSTFIKLVRRAMAASKKDAKKVDFADMIWLPLVNNRPIAQYDFIFIDETQDLNLAQIEIALRACAPGGRIFAVGDEKQAIYGFRGADSDAIGNVIRRLNAKTLPLSTTYRCAKSIVRAVNAFVPDLEAAPGAEEGSVKRVSAGAIGVHARPGDFVLSRSNAPLIRLCLTLLRDGTKAIINGKGKDIQTRLTTIVKRSRAKTTGELAVYVDTWRRTEMARLEAVDRPTDLVIDTAECLDALSEGFETTAEVIANITRLFAEVTPTSHIILSSTHKAKGLEADRVWMLEATYLKTSHGKKQLSEKQIQEEKNLYYVAVTRAKRELFLVEDEG